MSLFLKICNIAIITLNVLNLLILSSTSILTLFQLIDFIFPLIMAKAFLLLFMPGGFWLDVRHYAF